jgi:hypothetical protein
MDPASSRTVSTIVPSNGIAVLSGYNASASVDRGHLVLNDGVGLDRRHGRFARVGDYYLPCSNAA